MKHHVTCHTMHFGPVCINGGPNGEPVCEWCGGLVSDEERRRIQRMWDLVHKMTGRHKPKPKKEKR